MINNPAAHQPRTARSILKKTILIGGGLFLLLILTAGAIEFNYTVLNHRFTVITEGRVFRSAAIPPDELPEWIARYGIRTVVDLRRPGTGDPRNPEHADELTAEKTVVEGLGLRYFNVPSKQVPDEEAVYRFLEVMDDQANRPVLIHCAEGLGRAVLFSGLYRIEYENWENDRARRASRFIAAGSSFDASAPKGRFLMEYVPRRLKEGKSTSPQVDKPASQE